MSLTVNDWCNDIGISYRGLEIVERRKTHHNSVTLAKSRTVGHILILNGEVQHVEAWEFLYHETIVHVPLAFIRHPRSVLIMGGGSLNVLREVLKYKTIRSVTVVEQDNAVIDVMTSHDRRLRQCSCERRVRIVNDDAYAFIMQSQEKYDLIVNDALDLTMVSAKGDILKQLQNLLSIDGLCSDVVYRHMFERRTTVRTLSLLRGVRHKAFALVFVPEYPGILHLMSMWGNNARLDRNLKKSVNEDHLRWSDAGRVPCKYFDPRHMSYFLHLPRYVRAFINECQKNMRLKLSSSEGHSISS